MIDDFVPPPEKPVLSADQVHIWRAFLQQPLAIVEYCGQWLAEDERGRAARFHFDKDRNHFVIARGVLREILSQYLHVGPDVVKFIYNDQGKPHLANEVGQEGIQFNLSHSGDYALCAVTLCPAVGIDIELIRPEFGGAEIANKFFSTSEISDLQTLAPEEQSNAFFACWTRKEAFIKGDGKGLSIPLDQFDVTLKPGQPARLLRTQWDNTVAARWSLKQLNVHPDYAATLAVEGTNIKIEKWKWEFSLTPNSK